MIIAGDHFQKWGYLTDVRLFCRLLGVDSSNLKQTVRKKVYLLRALSRRRLSDHSLSVSSVNSTEFLMSIPVYRRGT